MSRLKTIYKETASKNLMEKFKFDSVQSIPKLDKVVINCCNKECLTNSKMVDAIINDLGKITGQKPVISEAKKSIAGFKLREGEL